MRFNGVEITQESIIATRKHFSEIMQGCIAEVARGEVKVNDQASYFDECARRSLDYMAGKLDYSVTFAQRAYWIQTGEMIALLP